MSAQLPEEFLNAHPRVDVSLLELYFVSTQLPPEYLESKGVLRSTDLWRGYVGTWRLNANGSLDLIGIVFPPLMPARMTNKAATLEDSLPKTATGDFTITFRPFFYGPSTEIPFVDGRIVEDRTKWRVEDQTLEVEATKLLTDAGLIVRTLGGPAFLPRTLLVDPGGNLASMVGQQLHCEVFDRDPDRGTLILRQINMSENRQ